MPGNSGAVTNTPPGGTYPAGTRVVLTATPLPGYIFDHWAGDASGTSPVLTVIMDRPKNVVAVFRRLFP